MGAPDKADTPESRNGNDDLAQLATNLRSGFESRLPAFTESQTRQIARSTSAQERLSEALKKHHRYTLMLVPFAVQQQGR